MIDQRDEEQIRKRMNAAEWYIKSWSFDLPLSVIELVHLKRILCQCMVEEGEIKNWFSSFDPTYEACIRWVAELYGLNIWHMSKNMNRFKHTLFYLRSKMHLF